MAGARIRRVLRDFPHEDPTHHQPGARAGRIRPADAASFALTAA